MQEALPLVAMLDAYGRTLKIATLAAQRDVVIARVIRVDRGVYTVMCDDGSHATSIAGELKDAKDPVSRPTIGDWVVVDADHVVREVLPRSSVFLRGDSEKLQAQAVAANVDVVFVVQACEELNVRRLERELVLAHQSGATPVVLLSKADQCEDIPRIVAKARQCAPGLAVIATSAVDGRGVADLSAYGAGGLTMAFIGASGAGKSTLVNAMLGRDEQSTGAVREYDGRGRHTTSARSLFALASGGVLIDTPGLRSIGMWRSDEGIAEAFRDIEELSSGCRFSDCSHDHEPHCAVRVAIEMGLIDVERVENYRLLQAELDLLDDEAESRKRVVKQQQRQATKAATPPPQYRDARGERRR